MLVAATLLLGACGGGARNESADAAVRDDTPITGRDCRRAEGDSAQAVCTALNEIERMSNRKAQVSAYQRRGDTTCVETSPKVQEGTDGGGVVEIVRGRLATAEMVDSGGCRKF
jgi:hypothetical protein